MSLNLYAYLIMIRFAIVWVRLSLAAQISRRLAGD
jgi:hypothetical protein